MWKVSNHEYRYWETLHVCNDGSPNYNINSKCWTSKCVRMRSDDPVSPNLTQSHPVSPSLTQSHLVSPSLTQSHPVSPSLTHRHLKCASGRRGSGISRFYGFVVSTGSEIDRARIINPTVSRVSGSPGVHEEGQEDDLETEQLNLKWGIGLLSRENIGFKANSH